MMNSDDDEDRRSLPGMLLDLELPLTELQDIIVALDLIASGSLLNGIDSDDMQGLKAVTRHARELSDRLRTAWSQILKQVDPAGS